MLKLESGTLSQGTLAVRGAAAAPCAPCVHGAVQPRLQKCSATSCRLGQACSCGSHAAALQRHCGGPPAVPHE